MAAIIRLYGETGVELAVVVDPTVGSAGDLTRALRPWIGRTPKAVRVTVDLALDKSGAI